MQDFGEKNVSDGTGPLVGQYKESGEVEKDAGGIEPGKVAKTEEGLHR